MRKKHTTDTAKAVWRFGLTEARERQWHMLQEPAWDADDSLEFINSRSHISEVAESIDNATYDEADDLQRALYGDPVLCYCGCGTIFPPIHGDFDRWDIDHGRNHLSYLYG